MSIPTLPLVINNKAYNVRANASILQACEENGIHIPRFCYHEKLSVAGNCRICLVEVEKSPKPVVSCAMPVSKGMVIHTETPLVKKVRESVLEFLLINHPLDCPICDQGGECDLQDETLQYGSDRGRYYEFKRSVEDKEVGPIIKTIMTRCIHCTRCVRFSAEVAGQELMGAFGRGEETEIGTYVQEFIKTELSGNLADICPVGALTSKPYAYKTRSWELQKVETIDSFDSLCTDIVVQTRKVTRNSFAKEKVEITTKEEIIRILPRANGLYEDNWISDKTRYAFDGLYKQRLKSVISNTLQGPIASQGEVLLELLAKLYNNNFGMPVQDKQKTGIRIGAVVDSLIDLEGLYILNESLKFYGSSSIQYGNYRLRLNMDLPNFYTSNRSLSNLNDITALLLIGLNTRYEVSILNTSLRKKQLEKDLSYFYLGATSDLKIKNEHFGLSSLKLLELIENKVAAARTLINTKHSSVLVGVESLKSRNGFMLQNLSRFLGKKLYLKSRNGERLSFIHATTTSVLFNALGISAGVRSNFYSDEVKDKKLNMLFMIQPLELERKKWLSTTGKTEIFAFSTHKPLKIKADRIIPIKSFYEKDGFLVNTEGRIRKFYKCITAPDKITSIDSFFITLLRAEVQTHKWLNTLNSTWRLSDEISLSKNLEKVNNFIGCFSYDYKEFAIFLKKGVFTKTINNFYNTDLISSNSTTMAESALFLNKRSNFLKH